MGATGQLMTKLAWACLTSCAALLVEAPTSTTTIEDTPTPTATAATPASPPTSAILSFLMDNILVLGAAGGAVVLGAGVAGVTYFMRKRSGAMGARAPGGRGRRATLSERGDRASMSERGGVRRDRSPSRASQRPVLDARSGGGPGDRSSRDGREGRMSASPSREGGRDGGRGVGGGRGRRRDEEEGVDQDLDDEEEF